MFARFAILEGVVGHGCNNITDALVPERGAYVSAYHMNMHASQSTTSCHQSCICVADLVRLAPITWRTSIIGNTASKQARMRRPHQQYQHVRIRVKSQHQHETNCSVQPCRKAAICTKHTVPLVSIPYVLLLYGISWSVRLALAWPKTCTSHRNPAQRAPTQMASTIIANR